MTLDSLIRFTMLCFSRFYFSSDKCIWTLNIYGMSGLSVIVFISILINILFMYVSWFMYSCMYHDCLVKFQYGWLYDDTHISILNCHIVKTYWSLSLSLSSLIFRISLHHTIVCYPLWRVNHRVFLYERTVFVIKKTCLLYSFWIEWLQFTRGYFMNSQSFWDEIFWW